MMFAIFTFWTLPEDAILRIGMSDTAPRSSMWFFQAISVSIFHTESTKVTFTTEDTIPLSKGVGA